MDEEAQRELLMQLMGMREEEVAAIENVKESEDTTIMGMITKPYRVVKQKYFSNPRARAVHLKLVRNCVIFGSTIAAFIVFGDNLNPSNLQQPY